MGKYNYIKNKENTMIDEILLIETADEFIYLTIKEILEDNNIPIIIKDDLTGGYMKIIGGFSLYNKKIFISIEDYEKAYDLVKEFIEEV